VEESSRRGLPVIAARERNMTCPEPMTNAARGFAFGSRICRGPPAPPSIKQLPAESTFSCIRALRIRDAARLGKDTSGLEGERLPFGKRTRRRRIVAAPSRDIEHALVGESDAVGRRMSSKREKKGLRVPRSGRGAEATRTPKGMFGLPGASRVVTRVREIDRAVRI